MPSKPAARELTDDPEARSIVVKAVQHRLRPDLTESYDRVAHFTLDPLCSRSINESLMLRDGPALFIKIIYKADSSGLTVMLLQAGRDLLTLNTSGPADSHMTLRLSQPRPSPFPSCGPVSEGWTPRGRRWHSCSARWRSGRRW